MEKSRRQPGRPLEILCITEKARWLQAIMDSISISTLDVPIFLGGLEPLCGASNVAKL
jgi:hypothetical protein